MVHVYVKREKYVRLSVMQADSVWDIITESWQDNKLISAPDARQTSERVRVSSPPEVENISWTNAARTNKRSSDVELASF